MAKHKKGSHEEHVDESWLIPYADLLTLLLALFIVLFASSSVDQSKYEAISQAFGASIGMTGSGGDGVLTGNNFILDMGGLSQGINPIESPENAKKTEYEQMTELKDEFETYFMELELEADVSIKLDERGLVISMTDTMMFDSGSADIKAEGADVLIKIAESVKDLDNYIRIEGHTDNVPVRAGSRYESNWELSSDRATKVVRLFIDSCGISPEKMVAVGYGEFRPAGDNSTAEGRAKNRRVDVIVLSEKFSGIEHQLDEIGEFEETEDE